MLIKYITPIENIYFNNKIFIALHQSHFDKIFITHFKNNSDVIKDYITTILLHINNWLIENIYTDKYFQLFYHPYKSYHEFFSIWNNFFNISFDLNVINFNPLIDLLNIFHIHCVYPINLFNLFF